MNGLELFIDCGKHLCEMFEMLGGDTFYQKYCFRIYDDDDEDVGR